MEEKKNKKLTEKETEKVNGGWVWDEIDEAIAAYQNSKNGDCSDFVVDWPTIEH